MLDEFRSTYITWDKATSRIYSPVTANASDENGRKLVVQIVNSGQVEDLTGATLHLYWETRDKAHDGLDVFKAVDLEKGEFELSYTTGMLSNHGVLNANLVLIDAVGRVVSERFKITVTEGIDNDAIQSENSFSSLTQALIDVSNLEQNYTPRLNDLTAQLAHKTDKGNVSVNDINKSLGKLDQTFMTDEFIGQFVENTQPINALTAPLSQTTIKLADKSVSSSKTTFMDRSNNLIDDSKVLADKTIDATTGEPVDNFAGNSLSDWIEVTPNSQYIGYRIARKGFYTQDKQFLSTTTGDGLFTTPDNCYWIRLVVIKTAVGISAQLNKGNVLMSFDSYSEHLNKKHLKNESVDLEKLTLLSKTNSYILSGNEIDFSFAEDAIKFNDIRLVYGNESILINQTLDISEMPSTSTVQRLLFYDKDTDLLQTRNAISLYDNRMSDNAIPIAIFRRYDNRVWGLNDYKINGVSIFKHNLDMNTEDAPVITDTFVLDTDINKLFDKNTTYPNMQDALSTSKSTDIYQMYDQLLSEHPNYITKELLGTESSPDALPIYKYEFKPKNPLNPTNLKVPKLIIASGIHPEKSSAFTLYHTMDNICNHWEENELLEALRFNFHFIIVPMASPWAYDNSSRTNYNGVDMARNFSSRWVQGSQGTPTYGGTAPLSEPEAVILNDLLLENQDAISVVDFHSFQGTVGSYPFIWTPTGNSVISNICTRFIQKIDRKWKKEYLFMSQNYDEFIGTVDNVGGGGLPGGSLAAQANSYGIRGSLTFEMCDYVRADTNGSVFDANVMTMGYEAFVNFILKSSFELTQR